MIFARMTTQDAVGAFLVHSIALSGQRMKKGRILNEEDVKSLISAGYDEILAARLEDTDLAEDEAAEQIAAAAQGAHVRLQAAFTGRANLFADNKGIVIIDRDRIDDLNLLDEAITIATVEPYSIVEPGQMLATVKIIPFAASVSNVDAASAIACNRSPLVSIAPFREKSAGVIMTRLPETKKSVLTKTLSVLNDRLTGLGSKIQRSNECVHRSENVAAAVTEQKLAGCDPILIFGASAITDRLDEVPSGIVEAGGEIHHFGMPVDPGNLLLLAELDGTPVIGLPGCARSPKLNGFDWVLQRLCADVAIGRKDIMRMGAGGLLKEISTRPQPRTGKQAEGLDVTPRAARIAGLVLAAGQSRRMGEANKLLVEIDGQAMVRHAIAAAQQSNLHSILVVTGHQSQDVRANLAEEGIEFAHNPNFADGLSSTLRIGIEHLSDDIDGVMIILGDMPNIRSDHIDRLIAAFNPLEGRGICVPTFNGKRGNPVLFSAELLAEITNVAGDVGAKHLIGQHEDVVAEVAMPDDAILLDIDTPEALADYQSV